jgi:hypothetical protein
MCRIEFFEIGAAVNKLLGVIITSIIFACAAIAQPIVSIGNFKIGMTEEEFNRLPDVKSKNIQDFSNYNFWIADSDIWRKTSESRNQKVSIRIYLSDHIEYQFKISTGIKDFMGKDSYEVTARFYKGELIEIIVNTGSSTTQFREILTEKYGTPLSINNMKKEICQNGYGARTEHNTGGLFWVWKEKNASVDASLMIVNFGCGKNAGAYYIVKDGSKADFVKNLEKEAEKNAKSEELKTKSSSSTL